MIKNFLVKFRFFVFFSLFSTKGLFLESVKRIVFSVGFDALIKQPKAVLERLGHMVEEGYINYLILLSFIDHNETYPCVFDEIKINDKYMKNLQKGEENDETLKTLIQFKKNGKVIEAEKSILEKANNVAKAGHKIEILREILFFVFSELLDKEKVKEIFLDNKKDQTKCNLIELLKELDLPEEYRKLINHVSEIIEGLLLKNKSILDSLGLNLYPSFLIDIFVNFLDHRLNSQTCPRRVLALFNKETSDFFTNKTVGEIIPFFFIMSNKEFLKLLLTNPISKINETLLEKWKLLQKRNSEKSINANDENSLVKNNKSVAQLNRNVESKSEFSNLTFAKDMILCSIKAVPNMFSRFIKEKDSNISKKCQNKFILSYNKNLEKAEEEKKTGNIEGEVAEKNFYIDYDNKKGAPKKDESIKQSDPDWKADLVATVLDNEVVKKIIDNEGKALADPIKKILANLENKMEDPNFFQSLAKSLGKGLGSSMIEGLKENSEEVKESVKEVVDYANVKVNSHIDDAKKILENNGYISSSREDGIGLLVNNVKNFLKNLRIRGLVNYPFSNDWGHFGASVDWAVFDNHSFSFIGFLGFTIDSKNVEFLSRVYTQKIIVDVLGFGIYHGNLEYNGINILWFPNFMVFDEINVFFGVRVHTSMGVTVGISLDLKKYLEKRS